MQGGTADSTPVPAVPILQWPATVNEPAEFHLGYRRWLDGFRGVAILLVLLFHARLIHGGAIGVDLFFVLSGFLITCLLAEEWQRSSTIHLRSFYGRRMLRLLPAFGVLLLVFIAHTLLFSPPERRADRWHELAVVVTYVANWNQLHGATLTMLGATWSLSVEEQFYLLWPPIFYLMLRNRISRPRIIAFVVVGIVSSALLRLGLNTQHRIFGAERTPIMRLYAGLDTRADALLAGCWAGLLVAWNGFSRSEKSLKMLRAGSVFSVLGLAFATYTWNLCSAQYYNGMFTVVAMLAAVFIIRMMTIPSKFFTTILGFTPLVFTGRISYSLYLFHMPVFIGFGEPDLGWRQPILTASALAASFAVATLSYFLIERPFLCLKGRLGLERSSNLATPSDLGTTTENPRVAA